jgi:hypothetical protein
LQHDGRRRWLLLSRHTCTAFDLYVCLKNLNRKDHQRTGEQIRVNLGNSRKMSTRVRSLFVPTLVLGCSFGTVTHAEAQTITTPTTPNAITPPAGNSAFLVGHAVGTQGYVCLPTSAGASTASWTVNASRPEATLYVKVFNRFEEVVTHFLSPIPTPIRPLQTRYLSAAQRGRVPSTAARCGDNRCKRFPLAPTRVARMLARLPASYCSRSGRMWEQPAVIS